MAKNKVIDVNKPRTTVPPKLEKTKITKPKNRMMDVYNMLEPVSRILLLIATGTKSS